MFYCTDVFKAFINKKTIPAESLGILDRFGTMYAPERQKKNGRLTAKKRFETLKYRELHIFWQKTEVLIPVTFSMTFFYHGFTSILSCNRTAVDKDVWHSFDPYSSVYKSSISRAHLPLTLVKRNPVSWYLQRKDRMSAIYSHHIRRRRQMKLYDVVKAQPNRSYDGKCHVVIT